MRESAFSLSTLKHRIAAIENRRPAETSTMFTLGVAAIDESLGGGLGCGRLHEIYAGEAEDGASAAGFALMLALRASNGPILWLRQDIGNARLHPPGLVELGFDPARLILVVAPDTSALLKAAADSLRCAGLGVVVIEPRQARRGLDLTASRRLALAAEQSGVTALLLPGAAEAVPSAAQSRWRVASAASAPLPANAPGGAAFDISLLRHRTGRDGLGWRVEWNRDQQSFREAPLSGAVLPVPFGRSASLGRAAA